MIWNLTVRSQKTNWEKKRMNEVEDAILGFHIFIVGLLFLAASILTLCGIAALVRLVSLLLSAYWKKIGFKYSFRWKQNFSRLGAIFRISALNQYLMLGGKTTICQQHLLHLSVSELQTIWAISFGYQWWVMNIAPLKVKILIQPLI